MKVTLPAAMDYTGAHSQAEYDTALEGRSKVWTDRDEPSGTFGPTRISVLLALVVGTATRTLPRMLICLQQTSSIQGHQAMKWFQSNQ